MQLGNRHLSYTIFALTIFSLTAFAGECQWHLDPEDPYNDILFPDSHATYWRMRVAIEPNKPVRFVVKGEYPRVRYMGLNVYRARTGNSMATLPDVKIQPDEGSENPFLPTSFRNVKLRNYSVQILQRDLAPDNGIKNVLFYPAPYMKPAIVEFWYRTYFPDRGYDSKGGTSLPTVEALDSSGAPISCPQVAIDRSSTVVGGNGMPPLEMTNQIHFTSSLAETTFPNLDNRYSITRLNFDNKRQFAMIRFKPPTTPVTSDGAFDAFRKPAEVRYWSLCIVGVSGEVSACLPDEDAQYDSKGYVRIVVGPEEFEQEIRSHGLNFLPRGKLFLPILVYRNILSDSFPETLAGAYLPKGSYYSAKDLAVALEFVTKPQFVSAPRKPRYGNGNRQVTSIAPASPTMRVGMSRDFFMGKYWHVLLTQSNLSRFAHTSAALSEVFEPKFSERVENRTGLKGKLQLRSSDILARSLSEGSLDFAIVPGYQYPWIARFYPGLEPLVYGATSPTNDGTTRVHILARPQLLDRLGGEPGKVKLSALKGLRLAAYPMIGEALFGLHQHLVLEGQNPEGFFNIPMKVSASGDEALACLLGRVTSADGKELVPCADIMLVSDNAYESLKWLRPGNVSSLDVLWSSSPIPLALVLYNPLKVQKPVGTVVEEALYGSKKVDLTEDQRMWMRTGLSFAFGIAELRVVDEKFTKALASHNARMRDIPEYFLPISFFPFGTVTKEPK